MDIINIIITIVSGIIGGNIAGAALPEDKNLGALGNSITGLLGGGLGSYIMQAVGLATTATVTAAGHSMTDGSFDFTHLLETVGGSGAGGAILTAIVGFIKSAIQK